jgi:putative ABC transport system substrate-binding protein
MLDMRRRDVIALLGGGAATVLPVAARAEEGGRVRQVGVLVGLGENDPEAKTRFAGFRQAFEKLGWFEGRNVRFDFRYAPGGARVQEIARELIALQPEVILAQGTPISAALKRETNTIPVVFVGNVDPVGSGFVQSLARPGGNLTGFLSLEASITGKWLTMLKEINPRLNRVALMSNPKTIPYDYYFRPGEAVAPSLGIELVPGRVENPVDIERLIESIARAPGGGLILPPDTTTVVNRDLIVALAARFRVPAMYAFRVYVISGGLMSYGTDFVDLFRLAASYVDRILRGAKPEDLPVQVPTKYESIVNVKTAKALGLEIPPTLLATADEVIE